MPTNVEEFLTKEERDERYRVLRSKENPPRGLVRFSESVSAKTFAGDPPPEMEKRAKGVRLKGAVIKRGPGYFFPLLRKLQFRKRAPGHCVWYVAWSN